jgi:hypothetical protein
MASRLGGQCPRTPELADWTRLGRAARWSPDALSGRDPTPGAPLAPDTGAQPLPAYGTVMGPERGVTRAEAVEDYQCVDRLCAQRPEGAERTQIETRFSDGPPTSPSARLRQREDAARSQRRQRPDGFLLPSRRSRSFPDPFSRALALLLVGGGTHPEPAPSAGPRHRSVADSRVEEAGDVPAGRGPGGEPPRCRRHGR